MKTVTRNEHGLRTDIEHIYDEYGLVNWRKMIKPEYLVPNKAKTQETDISKIEDQNLLILLAGIKHIAALRGFKEVIYKPIVSQHDYVAVSCEITWIPNYETEGREIKYSAIGDASPKNTDGVASLYFGPIAENRAFVRAVKNFLRIEILGKDEISKNAEPPEEEKPNKRVDSFTPVEMMKQQLTKRGKTLQDIIAAQKDKYPDAVNWKSYEDIPTNLVLTILSYIKSQESKNQESHKQ